MLSIKMLGEKITVCICSSRTLIDKDKTACIISASRKAGYEVNVCPDLCKEAISPDSDMSRIASTIVMACYPRAVIALFDSLHIKPEKVIDIRNGTAEEVFKELNINGSPTAKTDGAELELPAAAAGQEAWFPVIDKQRCTDCAKCHDFCLFGVYTIIEHQVKVLQPQNCKNNCPACARVCPQQAIIFPKYEKSPINGGLTDEEQFVELNTKELYNNALRMKLEERKKTGYIIKRDFK